MRKRSGWASCPTSRSPAVSSPASTGAARRCRRARGLRRTSATRRTFVSERNWRIVDELEAFAARRRRTLLELAFGWLLRDPVVASVIAGATSPEQIEQNVRAADWTPSAEDLAELDRITA